MDNLFQKLPSASDQIYDRVMTMIINGTLTAEAPMREQKLAEQFGVSRSPVRVALKRLIAEGVLADTPSKGVCVKKISPRDVSENYDLRVMTSGYAISFIVENRLPDYQDTLQSYYTRMKEETIVDHVDLFRALDTEFHNNLIDQVENPMFQDFAWKVFHMIRPYRLMALRQRERIVQSQKEHLQIIEAMLQGDIERAQSVNAIHFEAAKQIVLASMRGQKTE